MGASEVDAVEDSDLARVPLQAILVADSFTTKLEPITLECPKVLLPLVNTPMIDHTLAWLKSADVEQVFVLCCSQHSKQITNYLQNSKWVNQLKPNFSVTAIESHNAGDALRDVIHGDFILVSGDTVTNMMLTEALEEHKERQQEDNKKAAAVMTMVIKQSEACDQVFSKTGELIMAIDPTTKEVMYYEDKTTNDLKFDKSFLTVNPCLCLHNDKQDCFIDICSPQALSLLFTKDIDFVDYQQLRRDFFKGLLLVDEGGFKIFTHEIDSSSCYAARIDSFKSYKSLSKDIIQRRTKVGPFAYIGKDTCIGDKTVISNNSVVGDGCKIGCNVAIDGCYIWNNVTIQDGCKLRGAVLCDGAVMKSGAVLEPGVVLSYKVVVGPGFVVPCCSRVSLLPQPPVKQHSQDSDDNNLDSINGCGFIWSMSEVDHGEECRHSVVVAPPKPDPDVIFEKAVECIFLRAVDENNAAHIYSTFNAVDDLRFEFDIDCAKCVGALLRLIMKLALDTWRKNNSGCKNNDLVKETDDVISKWGRLLRGYSGLVDEKTHVIMKFEELCLGSMKEYAPFFVQVLNILYDKKIIQAEAILEWAHHAAEDESSDKAFVKQSKKFVQRLKEEKEDGEFQETDLKRLNEGGGVQVKKRQRLMS